MASTPAMVSAKLTARGSATSLARFALDAEQFAHAPEERGAHVVAHAGTGQLALAQLHGAGAALHVRVVAGEAQDLRRQLTDDTLERMGGRQRRHPYLAAHVVNRRQRQRVALADHEVA